MSFNYFIVSTCLQVFQCVANFPLSAWSTPKVMEMTVEMHSALAQMCMMEAQEFAIVKGLTGGISFTAVASLCADASSKAAEASHSIEQALHIVHGLDVQMKSEPRLKIAYSYLVMQSHAYRSQMCLSASIDSISKGKYGYAIAYMNCAKASDAETKVYVRY